MRAWISWVQHSREVPQELKRQLNLGYGLEVTGVTDGKMADAGIRKGFIILKANGLPIKSVNDLEDVLKAATQSPDQGIVPERYVPIRKTCDLCSGFDTGIRRYLR